VEVRREAFDSAPEVAEGGRPTDPEARKLRRTPLGKALAEGRAWGDFAGGGASSRYLDLHRRPGGGTKVL
jgi:hypothetical protein